jgi:hypothetical protein
MLVAVAILAVPIVLDYCVASCEGHQSLAAAPSCHHVSAGSNTGAVGRASSSCGHDHVASGAVQAGRIEPLRREFAAALAVVIANPTHAVDYIATLIDPHAPPGSSLTLFAQSLPLRI